MFILKTLYVYGNDGNEYIKAVRLIKSKNAKDTMEIVRNLLKNLIEVGKN